MHEKHDLVESTGYPVRKEAEVSMGIIGIPFELEVNFRIKQKFCSPERNSGDSSRMFVHILPNMWSTQSNFFLREIRFPEG